MTREHPSYVAYRAELVRLGVIYEDYEGPLNEQQIDLAQRLMAENQRHKDRAA